MMENWVFTNFDCPDCGESLECYTSLSDESYHDGDPLRCPECGRTGCVVVYENGIAEPDMDTISNH